MRKMIPAAMLVSALAPMACADELPLSANLDILEGWRNSITTAAAEDRTVKTAVVGDSITTKRGTWYYWMRNAFAASFGYGGEGVISIHPSSTGDDTGGYMPESVSVWSYGASTAWAREADAPYPEHIIFTRGTWASCLHAGGGWRMSFEGASADLRYIAEAGAGRINVSVDGMLVGTIDADNGGAETSVSWLIPIDGPGPHLLQIESLEPSGAPKATRLDSIDVRSGDAGSVTQRLGMPGKPPSYFLEKDWAMYQSVFDGIAAELLLIQCDPDGGEPMDQYEATLRDLVDHYQQVAPGMPIVLITHHNFSSGAAAPAAVMHTIATDTANVGFINVFDLHASPADLGALDYLLDSIHLTTTGGQFYDRWIRRELLGYPRSDLDVDGDVDLSDLGILLATFDLQIGDDGFDDIADINRDGTVDLSDLGALLADFDS
jgi:hypothetical protein